MHLDQHEEHYIEIMDTCTMYIDKRSGFFYVRNNAILVRRPDGRFKSFPECCHYIDNGRQVSVMTLALNINTRKGHAQPRVKYLF